MEDPSQRNAQLSSFAAQTPSQLSSFACNIGLAYGFLQHLPEICVSSTSSWAGRASLHLRGVFCFAPRFCKLDEFIPNLAVLKHARRFLPFWGLLGCIKYPTNKYQAKVEESFGQTRATSRSREVAMSAIGKVPFILGVQRKAKLD